MNKTYLVLVWASLTLIICGISYRNLVVNERKAETTRILEENKVLGNKCIQRVHKHHASSDVNRKGAYGQYSYNEAYTSEFNAITECIVRYPMQDSDLIL